MSYQSFSRFLALEKFHILVYGNPNQSAFLDAGRTASKRRTASLSPQYFQSRYTTVVRSVIYKATGAYQYHHLAVNSRCRFFLLFDNPLLILNKQNCTGEMILGQMTSKVEIHTLFRIGEQHVQGSFDRFRYHGDFPVCSPLNVVCLSACHAP